MNKLFRVRNNTLEADFSGIEITRDNALSLSIKKWRFIFWWLFWRPWAEYLNNGAHFTCALCTVYYVCVGCPIFKATKFIGCRGTPYYEFADAADTHSEQLWAAFREWRYLVKLEKETE